MKRLVTIVLMMAITVGCSVGGLKEIKTSDLCVTHISFDSKICYGDERKSVEVISGKAELEQSNFVSYANDLNITYRDDKVILIAISEGSKDVYNSLLHVQIGETRKDLKKKFGDSFNSDMPIKELNYLFDVKNKTMITNESLIEVKEAEDAKRYMSLLISFDESGNAKRIYLSDWFAIKYGI